MLAYYVMKLISKVFCLLPLRAGMAFGQCLGWLALMIVPKWRMQMAAANVQECLHVSPEEAKQIAKKLSEIKLEIKVKAGENGKIFGGVSSKEIVEKLEQEYNIKVDKKKVDLKEAIKVLGVTIVDIKLYEGVIGKLKVKTIS